MSDRDYFIATSSFISFGAARIKLLVKYFGSAKKVFLASRSDLLNVGLSHKIATDFIKFRDEFDFDTFFGKLKKTDTKVYTLSDADYPENLKDLDDAPPILFIRGTLNKNNTNAVAIVGSRMMTSYGREATRKLSSELAGLGITIVSGLAFGVDVEAHRSALEVSGHCIAVLGSGIDKITPRTNEWLGVSILKKGGAIVSEYPPGVDAQKYFFPYRNRIISGLSRAIIVVEGLIKSGTIHTARHAAAQGRTVFAIPGQITSPTSAAPHYLLKNGAKMVTEISDILEELNMELRVDLEMLEKSLPKGEFEEEIVKIIENEELHVDEIGRILHLMPSVISAKLTVMELRGMVKNLGGGIYRKV